MEQSAAAAAAMLEQAVTLAEVVGVFKLDQVAPAPIARQAVANKKTAVRMTLQHHA